MDRTIYFEELKFIKSDYRFLSKKHRDLYFDQVILDDVYEYRRQFNAYMDEKLNVICTWQETIKYAAFVALAVSLALLGYGASLITLVITIGISVFFITGALLLEWYFNRYAQTRELTSAFLAMEEFLDGLENQILEEEYGISLQDK